MCTVSKTYSLDKEDFQRLREYFSVGRVHGNERIFRTVYLFAMTTECIKFFVVDDTRPDENELMELSKNGLEVRVFDKDREAKWFRASIDKKFGFRLLDDDILKLDNLYIWDESQYLDIDDRKTEESIEKGTIQKGTVFATGGGKYPFPIEKYKNAKIQIRNYLGEDLDTGELYIKDWRLVGFDEGEEERGRKEDDEIHKSI